MTALRPLVRPLLAFALGLGVPLACDRGFARLRAPWAPGPPRVWVADRDAGRLVALDRGLYVAAAADLVAPVAVAARADGGAWALDAVDRRPDGALALVRVDAAGAVRAAVPLAEADPARRDAPARLAALAGGDALVCLPAAGPALARVLVVDARGSVSGELRRAGVRAAAGRGGTVLVGAADGGLAAFDRTLDLALVGLGSVAGPVLDVAPAPGGDWWVLSGGTGERRLWLVSGAALAPRWEAPVELAARRLAAPPAAAAVDLVDGGPGVDGGGVWLVSTARARVRRQPAFRPPTAAVDGLPLGGFGAAAARGDGALYLPAPGALLELDPAGRLVRSQGGFDFLVAASEVP